MALESLPQGMVYLWARLFDPRGNRSRPLTMRLLIDAGRPQVGTLWPADGSRAAPATIGLELKDEQGAGLDLETLRLKVNEHVYAPDGKVLSYDGGRLVWDGRRAEVPVVFKDGEPVSVALQEARDLAGNRPASLPSWRFTMDYQADRRGPEVEVTSRTHPANLNETFEAHGLRWTLEPGAAATASTAEDGRGEGGRALLIQPAGDKPWAVWSGLEHPYAASRFGLVAFDYRLSPGTQLDLLVRARDLRGTTVVRAVTITDQATEVARLGAIEGAVADGAWHQAVVPLQALLAKDQAFRVPFVVEQIGFGDLGAAGGRPSQPIAIDNVMVFREATSWLGRVSWAAYDETGVKGYSIVLDQQPRTVPPPQVMETGTEQSWRDLPSGYSWFHIRAVDGAGNWGPTAHFLMKTPAR
ncbi:MAG: hypothetical protein HUU33_13385 [Flavobacteriales bacterium]|nr:hypothetical protein [Flavobacteriales bacterium]